MIIAGFAIAAAATQRPGARGHSARNADITTGILENASGSAPWFAGSGPISESVPVPGVPASQNVQWLAG